uniref:Uncharacterized protein MANES_03G152300 n=1 Tax=Rhizophora mucronata TaxID=61149 RepID=A0A2P2MQ93_RHIMU
MTSQQSLLWLCSDTSAKVNTFPSPSILFLFLRSDGESAEKMDFPDQSDRTPFEFHLCNQVTGQGMD